MSTCTDKEYYLTYNPLSDVNRFILYECVDRRLLAVPGGQLVANKGSGKNIFVIHASGIEHDQPTAEAPNKWRFCGVSVWQETSPFQSGDDPPYWELDKEALELTITDPNTKELNYRFSIYVQIIEDVGEGAGSVPAGAVFVFDPQVQNGGGGT